MQKYHGKFSVYQGLCYRDKIKKSSQQNNFVKITTQMKPTVIS